MEDSVRAHAALAETERVRQAVHRSSRWYAGYLTVFGMGTVAAVAMIGLIRGPVSAVVWGLAWASFVTVLSLYVVRQRVKGRGYVRVHFITLAAMFVVYAPVLTLGVTAMAGTWWWYPAAAPVVALPLFTGAYYWAART